MIFEGYGTSKESAVVRGGRIEHPPMSMGNDVKGCLKFFILSVGEELR